MRQCIIVSSEQRPAGSEGLGPVAAIVRLLDGRWSVDWQSGYQSAQRDRVMATIAARVRENGLGKLPVILSGFLEDIGPLAWAIAQSGLRRRVAILLHIRADAVPLPARVGTLIALSDARVVETEFARRAVVSRNASKPVTVIAAHRPTVAQPSRHGPGQDLCVGYLAGDDFDPEAAICAMQAFRIAAQGLATRCVDCAAINVGVHRPEINRIVPQKVCPLCCGAQTPIAPWPRARLVVASGVTEPAEILEALGQAAAALGIAEQCQILAGADLATWVKRLHIHVCPHHGAAANSMAQITASSGIPTVATAFGAAESMLSGPVYWARPAITAQTTAGVWRAYPRMDDLVDGLLRAAQDGAAPPNSDNTGTKIGLAWDAVLTEVSAGSAS